MNKLEELLNERGITQTMLANELKISQSSISLWLNKKTLPRFKTMQKLADALDVDLQTIVACFVQDKKQQKTKKE